MDSKTCGKVCLVGCIIIVVLVIIIIVAGVMCGRHFFGGLFSAIGNSIKIQGYFDDLEAQGWEVDDSQSNQPSGYGASVEDAEPMIWRARENPDDPADEWILYVWELRLADTEAWERLEEEELPQDWQAIFNWMIVPRTEAALEVHEELNLSLPDDFELDPWEEEKDGDDRERPDKRDRDQDEDDDDGEQRNGKSMRRAA